MFLYFGGCSYVTGVDLENREVERFSTLVSNHYNADHLNNANSGESNDVITRKAFEFIKDNKPDYAIINMTHCERMELLNPRTNTTYKFHAQHPKCKPFYENYYNHYVGSLNYYKNRYLLESEFRRRGIPLILMQINRVSLKNNGNNIYREMCDGELPTISTPKFSPEKYESMLGEQLRNMRYYYHKHDKKIHGHFNSAGHRKIADFIISKIDSY